VRLVRGAEGNQGLAADAEVEEVGAGVVAGDVERELFFADAVEVELGGAILPRIW